MDECGKQLPVADTAQNQAHEPLFVVGVGASAGGLEALEKLFHSMPAETGMAFVVVQHLSPDFDSVMDELLVRQTDIPVHTAADGMLVEPNAIYLIPPKKEMIISGGKLLLTDRDPKQGLTLPIDVFLRSLAQDVDSRSIGLILSGTGSDGSRGIRDIHEAGGLVIVQSEDTARFDGMPKSAVSTGIVDLVLAPEKIGQTLAKYAQHPIAADLAAAAEASPVDEHGMNKLVRLLREAYGIDFSLYKPSTVTRRVERRLLLNQAVDFEQYVDRLASDPCELNSLYHDLLIGVTQFFRDPDAFAQLDHQLLPELLSKVPPDEELRMWVVGCASGEEAYSLAIVVHEHLTRMNRPLNVKIFATDVHQSSLEVASTGVYCESSLADVSPERLKRYFTRKGDHYQVSSDLRQMIVFAPHNIIKDAPFTRLDLISCRNVLIYLQPAVQKKVISLFHFGLRAGGVLLLGPSEGVGDLEDEFAAVDRHWKLYRKRRDVRLPTDMRLPLSSMPRVNLPLAASAASAPRDGDLGEAYDELLERYVPPSVLIDDRGQVVHVFAGAGDFLHFKSGRTTNNILDLFDGDLKTAVSGAIQRASREAKPVAYSGVKVGSQDGARRIKLGVTPLKNHQAELTHMLVTLENVQPPAPSEAVEAIDIGEVSRERIALLESELRHSKENLQATIEELETSNEELHATNEELVASNEELQSTNEELHSVNEELYTVNAEYQRKITELTELTDDMENLLASTDVGVMFLDKELCIRKFTPRIAQSFNVVQQDVGRPFQHFSHNIEHTDLVDDVRRVLDTGEVFEREVRDRLQNWHFLRILPYRSQAGVDGVVITLIDIQSLKKAQDAFRETDARLHGILDNSPAFIFVKDLQGHYLLANGRSRHLLRTPSDSIEGKTDYDFLPRSLADRMEAQDRQVASSGKTSEIQVTLKPGGKPRTCLSTKYPLRDTRGRISAVAGIWTDISRQKAAERRARAAADHRDRFLAMLSHELRNPLAAVQNAIQLLHRADADTAAKEKAGDVIGRQTEQMRRLLDDLLDISRITQERIDLRKRIFDLRQTADDAVLASRSAATSHELKLNVNLPDEPLYVNGDAARLQQVQVNLLVNAVKYTPPGGSIDYCLQRKDNQAVIRVRDTGVGMSKDLQRRVFDLFVQGDETLDRSQGGMGVGLTLVRSLVEKHGGSVRAISAGPGKGSEFTVSLPLSGAPTQASHESELPELQAGDATSLRLVIVEDDADARDMLRMLLETYGYRVDTAADGLSAVRAIETEQPDVAFVDIGLPELDGYGVARRIRKTEATNETYLVALTGYGQPADRRKSRDAGFDNHLTKPVKMDDLLEILTKVAKQRMNEKSHSS